MGFSVSVIDHHLEVTLSGRDALRNARRLLRVPLGDITQVEIATRAELEPGPRATLENRARGSNLRKPGGRHVGAMLGATDRREFWAVSGSAHEVVWITLSSGEWSDVVVEHPAPEELVARLTAS